MFPSRQRVVDELPQIPHRDEPRIRSPVSTSLHRTKRTTGGRTRTRSTVYPLGIYLTVTRSPRFQLQRGPPLAELWKRLTRHGYHESQPPRTKSQPHESAVSLHICEKILFTFAQRDPRINIYTGYTFWVKYVRSIDSGANMSAIVHEKSRNRTTEGGHGRMAWGPAVPRISGLLEVSPKGGFPG